MLSSLARMVQDAVAVVSAGAEVDVHSVSGTAGDLHASLVRYMDNAISMVLMGQTLTADIGTSGSRAASETHYDVLKDLQDADETIIATFMEDLAWVYGQVNAPGAPSPVFSFREPEDYNALAELDKKLVDTGVRFTREHYVRRYNLAEDEFDMSDSMDKSSLLSNEPPESADHSAPVGRFTPDQQALEDLVAGMIPAGGAALGHLGHQIDSIIARAESFEDVRIMLAELMDEDDQELAEGIQRALLATDLHGREEAESDH